jgi:hypothetical protein
MGRALRVNLGGYVYPAPNAASAPLERRGSIPVLKKALLLLVWLVVGGIIGFILSTLFWSLPFVWEKNLGWALAGQVENAISTLEAMITIGLAVGSTVGVVYGVVNLLRTKGGGESSVP